VYETTGKEIAAKQRARKATTTTTEPTVPANRRKPRVHIVVGEIMSPRIATINPVNARPVVKSGICLLYAEAPIKIFNLFLIKIL